MSGGPIAADRERRRLHVRGTVQGVGFRPFVHRMAVRHGLGGFVGNDGRGVVIEAEGDRLAVEALVAICASEHRRRLACRRSNRPRCPPAARVGFSIAASTHGPAARTFRRTSRPATSACGSCSTRPIAATSIRSSTARTAGHASRSCAPRPTTAPTRRCPVSRCASACRGGVRRSRRPALPRGADRLLRVRPAADDRNRTQLVELLRGRRRSWRSRASAAFTSPATRPARARSRRLRERKQRDRRPFAVMCADPHAYGRSQRRRARAAGGGRSGRSCWWRGARTARSRRAWRPALRSSA